MRSAWLFRQPVLMGTAGDLLKIWPADRDRERIFLLNDEDKNIRVYAGYPGDFNIFCDNRRGEIGLNDQSIFQQLEWQNC